MNKENIIVLGEGFLGTAFKEKGYKTLGKSQFTFPSNLKSDFDVHTIRKLDNYEPQVVINTIAYTNTKDAQTNPEKSIKLNSCLPKYLSEYCSNRNIKFVHISTGCVYSTPHSYKKYSEDSPLSVYVASKLLGDSFCNLERDLIIRPRLVFGHFEHKNNILSKLIKFDSFLDEKNSMTSVETIIESVEALLENSKSGIYNVAQEGTISMYEIAEMFDKFIKKELYNKFKKNKILMSPNIEVDISKLKEVYTPRNIYEEVSSCYERLTGLKPILTKEYKSLPRTKKKNDFLGYERKFVKDENVVEEYELKNIPCIIDLNAMKFKH